MQFGRRFLFDSHSLNFPSNFPKMVADFKDKRLVFLTVKELILYIEY